MTVIRQMMYEVGVEGDRFNPHPMNDECAKAGCVPTGGEPLGTINEGHRRNPKSERFHQILQELGELHDRKQRDYGRATDPFANIRASEDWGIKPHVGALLRMNDKVRRLQSWIINGNLANEGAEDSMRDIAVYAIIALVLLEDENANPGS